MDEELRRLDLEISQARRQATKLISALAEPQQALRSAAAAYVESLASRRIEAARRASTKVVARLSDDDVADLRFWTEAEVERVREQVERDIETCDFWIPESTGMSISDVGVYGSALVPRPKDSESGIPQTLVYLFEHALYPLHKALAIAGLTVDLVDGDPRKEVALLRAWRLYRERAVECLAEWADIDAAYQDSSARFQEHRWELARESSRAAYERRLAAAKETTHPVADDGPKEASATTSAAGEGSAATRSSGTDEPATPVNGAEPVLAPSA